MTYSAESSDGDVGLSYHYDNAEVTLNVSLGKEYNDGELYFGDMKGVRKRERELSLTFDPHLHGLFYFIQVTVHNFIPQMYHHKIGRGVLHRGQHMHGALDINKGERYNLIIWMRSSSVRNNSCPRCGETPKLVPFEGYGDGFVLP